MVLMKSLKFLLRQTLPRKSDFDVLDRNLACLDHKRNRFKKVVNFPFFSNKLVHGFRQKFKVSSWFPFW